MSNTDYQTQNIQDPQYPQQGYVPPQQQYPQQQYPQQQYPQQPYPQQTYPQQQYPQQQYPQQQYPQQPYPQQQGYVEQTIKSNDIKDILNEDFEQGIDKKIDDSMRIGFIRKVYGVLSMQLFVTCCLIGLTFIPSVKEAFHGKGLFLSFTIIGMVGMFIFSILVGLSASYDSLKRYGLIFLIGFSLSMSMMLMAICAHYNSSVVLTAASITTGLVFGITVYSIKSSGDFTYCASFLFGFLGLMLVSTVFFIISIFNKNFIRPAHILYSIGGVLLFSLYLIYDTQLVLGKFGIQYSIDDYCLAALNLYIDIINIFIYILSIFGNK